MIMTQGLTGFILIVDDTPTNLDVISEALSNEGYKVAIATSGERALQQVDRKPPDLILLDIMMPGIDGFETCRRLKANPETKDIPVIFMTALNDTDSKVQALNLGGVDYVTKPFQEQEVMARLKTHLQLYYLTRNLAEQVAQKTAELQSSQLQLIQGEKMSALGNLVAGVAHEINNPVSFLGGNIKYALEHISSVFNLLDMYQQELPDASDKIQAEIEAIELDYIREDLPNLIGSMEAGVNRIREISTSLRTFSRADSFRPIPFNLHEGIDSTILILKHRLKPDENRPEIEIVKNYGQIPSVKCFAGQLNQVFMNLLANAIDALDESNQGRSYGDITANPNRITITTSLADQYVKITIADNGKGMSEEVQAKIFDHLFTTKEVSKGTGLGLAIARQIVVEKHGGKLAVSSTLGQGTEFTIQIPLTAK